MSKPTNVPVEQELLIRQLRDGKETAYEYLFKEYYIRLTIYANKFIEDMDLAKEIVQDLMVNIYEKRETLNIKSSLSSYLYRAVRNRSLNTLNSQKHKAKYCRHIKYTSNKSENPIESLMNITDLETALFSAINELPPKCREIFKLNRFSGLSNSEIAEQLDLSKRTVETQVSKALKILKSKLHIFLTDVAIIIFLFWISIK